MNKKDFYEEQKKRVMLMDEIKAEDYLLQIPMWTKKKNSPADIRLFLEELGSPQKDLSIIHVAGTNGKGSVCAYLTSILREQGYRVGTFTSPHLVEIRERISIDGTMVDQELFQDSFRKVLRMTERMTARGYCHPSFFEYLFYMALNMFQALGAMYVILETGLGGRLDTTNVIDHPLMTVITSISMDHMEYLGDTIELIAGEKAGIIKPDCPVVYADNQSAVSWVIEARANALEAPLIPVSETDCTVSDGRDMLLDVSFTAMDGQTVMVNLPFTAPYQVENMLLAVRTIEVLNHGVLSWEPVKRGIRNTRWPGRMEEVLPGVYLDGAHNIGGITAFAKAADRLRSKTHKPLILLFAVSADKEYRAMIRSLTEDLKPDYIAVAHMCNPRGLDSETLRQTFRKGAGCPVESFLEVEAAYLCAMEKKGEDGLLFCVGSLYLIGEMKEIIRRYSHD